jgi:NADH-quinone oxidoreductase subunit L
MSNYFWLIPLFPALGVFLNGLFGIRYFSKKVIHTIACSTIFLSFLLGVISFFDLVKLPADERFWRYELFTWIPGGIAHLFNGHQAVFNITASFQFDPLTAVMVLVVSGVGFLIHIYSIGYMWEDKGYGRYFVYLNLFTFAMLVLVMASNLVVMFIGWEGVGLCSYLLIGFWFERERAANAGKKAFIVTRIGDFGFLLGIMFVFFHIGSVEFRVIEEAVGGGEVTKGVATLIGLLLFMGAVGKSAQIPLYVWLPDAMEGPTPVSALIHAATMVTAGVYMVTRMNVLYSYSGVAMEVVGVVGAVTAVYAATMALVQNDIKRVLAYSTISQIGYMFMGCGVGAYTAGMFHLTTHAFFKSLLFLAAGSVMHALSGELDMRKMGGLKRYLPLTYPTFLIGAIAIAGVPPFSGFFSKDEILTSAFSSGRYLIWGLGIVGAVLTAFYMFRLIYMTFHGEERTAKEVRHHVHESPKVMTVPLMILAGLSVIGGFIGLPEVLGGRNWFRRFLEPVVEEAHYGHLGVSVEYSLIIASVVVAVIGIYTAYLFYLRKPELSKRTAEQFPRLYKILYNKYYVDEAYNLAFVKPTLNLGTFLADYDLKIIDGAVNGSAFLTRNTSAFSGLFDLKIVDGIVNRIAWLLKQKSFIFRKVQTGTIQNYALAIIFGLLIFITLTLFL